MKMSKDPACMCMCWTVRNTVRTHELDSLRLSKMEREGWPPNREEPMREDEQGRRGFSLSLWALLLKPLGSYLESLIRDPRNWRCSMFINVWLIVFVFLVHFLDYF